MNHFIRLTLLATLLLSAALPLAQPPHALATGTGSVTGIVFFDVNADGVRDSGDEGVGPGLTIELRDAATQGQVFLATTTTGLDGSYAFTGLNPNTYVVTETSLESLGYTRTTNAARTVTVVADPVGNVDFGGTLLITLSGTIFDDVNQDGIRGLGEAVIADALVEVFHDTNANGVYELGEPLAGSNVTNSQGNYVVANLWPGLYTVRVQPPGAISAPVIRPITIISRNGGGIQRQDVGIIIIRAGNASLSGVVWKDLDGDEIMDADEGVLPNAALALYHDSNGNRLVDSGEPIAAQATSNNQGLYTLNELTPGNYVLVLDDLTLPANWTPSFDPALLAFALIGGETRTLDLGYFDPLVVAPMGVADWKKEIRQNGHPRYTAAEVATFIASAQNSSSIFPELVSLEDAIFDAAPREEDKARKVYAALRLNVASGLLMTRTPVNLPNLTTAVTIGGVLTEIESLLDPPASQLDATYRRLEDLAEALDEGEGIGYGLAFVAAVTRATYRGNDVTSALRRAGGDVDMTLDQPIIVTRWSPGSLDPNTNILRPRVRVRVNTFYNGGVLDAFQRLPDGRLVQLGTIVPPFWNKDVKTDYTFDLWRVSTLAQLVSTEIRLVTRDPDGDGGHVEHIKIDAAEVMFDY